MSELRQRRGESADADQSDKDTEIAKLKAELAAAKAGQGQSSNNAGLVPAKDEEEAKKAMAEQITKSLEESLPKPAVMGLSHQAKEAKKKLDADPFNMLAIFELGLAYGEDRQWERCTTVLMRGWKRVGELTEANERYAFCACLIQASLKTNKFRQSLAVMNEMEDPQDDEQKAHHQELRCNVFCENGDLQKALQAWNKTIEGLEFQDVVPKWARLLGPMRKVGAMEVTRSGLMELTKSDQDVAQIEAVEKLMNLREDMIASGERTQGLDSIQKKAIAIAGALGFVVLTIILYWYETHSAFRMGSESITRDTI